MPGLWRLVGFGMRSTVGLWYADRRVNVPNRKVSPVSPDHPGWALIRSHPGIILGLALGDPEKPEKPSGWWLPDKLSGGEDRLDPLRCAARVSRWGVYPCPGPNPCGISVPTPLVFIRYSIQGHKAQVWRNV